MIKKYIIIVCSILCGQIIAQSNYIQNADFETLNGNPNCALTGGMLTGVGIGNPNSFQTTMENLWNFATPWKCPGQKPGVCRSSAASSDFRCTSGRNGSHGGYFENGEFICQPMNASLTTGNNYYVEFWAKSGAFEHNTEVKTGLRFLTNLPHQCGYKRLSSGNGPAHVLISTTTENDAWVKIKGYVVADKNYSWINIGHHDPTKKVYGKISPQPSGVFIDDFKMIDLGPGFCPTINYIQNKYFADIGEVIYRSQNLTTSGSNVNSTETSGPVTVSSTGTVSFKSGVEVALMDGFSADPGSEFKAYIAPCGNECPNISAFAGEDVTICGSVPANIQLGSSAINNSTYQWSLGGYSTGFYPGGLSYLSSTSISNPVFTPPSTPIAITYRLKVTDPCGTIARDEVTIKIDPSPSSNVGATSLTNVSTGYNNVNFTANFSPHTEYVYVEIYEGSTLLEEYEAEAGVDFAAGATSWGYNNHNPKPNCKTITVKVYTSNFCYDNLSTPAYISWSNIPPANTNPVVSPIASIFTPNGDAVNDCFGVTVSGGISSCDVEIGASSNGIFHQSSNVTLVDGFNCLWNGMCDNGPNCTCNCLMADGVYYYVIDFYDCAGNYLQQNVGFLTLMDGESNRINNTVITNTIQPNEEQQNNFVILHPNPNNGNFTIITNEDDGALKSIEIQNGLGITIQTISQPGSAKTEISITDQPSGLYLVKLNYTDKVITKKMVKQ